MHTHYLRAAAVPPAPKTVPAPTAALGHKASEWFFLAMVMSFMAGLAASFSEGIGCVLALAAFFAWTCFGVSFCRTVERIAERD